MGRGEFDRLVAAAAAQIGMNHVTLDRAWADDGNLDDEVVELPRPQPRQHVHLRPAFHLEHADRVSLAQHVVNGGIVGRHGAEREIAAVMLLQKSEALADAGEHAEAEHIDLEQPERIEVVLVPFDEGAVLHGGVADGHDLGERPARQHEAADMLGEMAREAEQLLGELETAGEQRVGGIEPSLAHIVFRQGGVAQTPDGGGERRYGVLREAERLADLAHRGAAAIGDDGGGDAGAVAAVTAVDILDHLLAPLMLEIDVDVGRLLPLRRDEALEQEVDLGRVDIGDGEAIADGGVRRRAPPLAENVEVPRVMHDVVHGEEVARVVELLDQRELLVERFAHLVGDAAGETPGGAFPGEIFEMRLGGLALGHRLVGIFVFQLIEGEGAGVGDLDGAGERILMAGEQPRHFLRRLQVPLGIGFELQACVMDGAFLADAGEHVLQGPAMGGVIEHCAGGDEGSAHARRELRKRFDAGAIIAAIRHAARRDKAACVAPAPA